MSQPNLTPTVAVLLLAISPWQALAEDGPPMVPNPHLVAPEPFEGQRRDEVARQLALNDYLRFNGGNYSYWRPATYSPALDYIEARLWSLPGSWPAAGNGFFERWVPPLRQPIGHAIHWHGPGSYTYEPVYKAPPVVPLKPLATNVPAPEEIPPPVELREF